mgnify:CR=1 FL=1
MKKHLKAGAYLLNYRRFDLSAGDAPLKKTAIYNKATAHPAQAVLTASEPLELFEAVSTMITGGKKLPKMGAHAYRRPACYPITPKNIRYLAELHRQINQPHYGALSH